MSRGNPASRTASGISRVAARAAAAGIAAVIATMGFSPVAAVASVRSGGTHIVVSAAYKPATPDGGGQPWG